MTNAPGINQIIQPHEKTAWLPTDPPRPAPEVMSAEDAALYLGLGNSNKARQTLEYYRVQGKLKGTRIGREMKYRLAELQRFVREQETSA